MIYFFLGVIVGLLIRDIKCAFYNKVFEGVKALKEASENKGETQFIDPITPKERFNDAESLDDLLDNYEKK